MLCENFLDWKYSNAVLLWKVESADQFISNLASCSGGGVSGQAAFKRRQLISNSNCYWLPTSSSLRHPPAGAVLSNGDTLNSLNIWIISITKCFLLWCPREARLQWQCPWQILASKLCSRRVWMNRCCVKSPVLSCYLLCLFGQPLRMNQMSHSWYSSQKTFFQEQKSQNWEMITEQNPRVILRHLKLQKYFEWIF